MKNLTQLPWSGKGSKAKNDKTLGRMHVGIRSRIGSMSLKNTSLFGVILTLLLTLGVGEMWGATTWTVAGDNTTFINGSSTWAPTETLNDMTNTSGTKWVLLKKSQSLSKNAAINFKVCKDHGWGTAYPGDNYYLGAVGTAGTYNIIYVFDTGNSNNVWAAYYTGWRVAGTDAVFGTSWDETDASNNMTKSSDYVYTLTKTNVSLAASTTYELKCVTPEDKWKFERPSSNKTFTVATAGRYDVTITLDLRDAASSSGGVTVSTAASKYTITLNNNGATGAGTTSVTATYNSSTLASITNPTKTGYNFAGWYTGEGGTGTLVINTSGALQANVTNYTGVGGKWVGTEAKTLYAKWTEKTYSLTFSSTNGSIAVGGANVASGSTASVNHVTTKALVATPSDGYQFVNWTLSGSNTSAVTIGDANASSTTIKATAAGATVTANFELIPASNYDISYTTASTGWSYGVKPTSAAEGDVVTFVVNPTDGYTVSVTSSDVAISGPNASNQYTFTMPDNDVSITVSATEKKRNVTISTSPIGAGSLDKTSASVGVTTTTTVTATAQPGYKFSSWTATNCNVASTTSASTTLSGDGGTGSATLVANFDRTYAFIEGRFHIMNEARTSSTNTFSSGDWDDGSTRIPFGYDDANHQFVLSTHVTPKELTDKLGSCGDCKQYFFIKTSTASGSLTNPATYRPYTSGDSYQVFTTAGDSYKKQTITPGNSEHSYRFNSSDESGYVKLYFNLSHIWYWLEQTLEYNANGGTGDAPAARTYYDRDQSIQAGVNAYTRDGYTFSGWNTQADGLGTAVSENGWFTITANTTLHAQWTPVGYTITLDKQTGATGYGSSGTAANPTATYNAVLPAISGTMPAGTGSYGFMGFYTGTLGTGLRLTDASGAWIASVEGYTDADTKWIHAGDVTLYAYYKQAEISELTPDPAIIAPGETVTVTPTLSPAPAETHIICWELQYSNGTALPSQPTFTPGVGNAVSFPAPSASATYRIQATLRSGSSCGGGSVLSTRSETFQVAGEHTVTIQYQDADGRTIKASTEITARPLAWTTAGDITPPTITGYTFARWDAGDGVSIKNGDSDPVTTTTTSSIQIKATYDGTLTAVYTKKRMIYFYNTLNWGSVYVYFYKNDSYWETSGDKRGSGSKTTSEWTDTPYSEGLHGPMLPVSEGSNIYYFDAEAEGVNASYDDVVFTEHQQHGYEYFYQTNAVRRGDYKSSIPMFVPLADQEADVHNQTNYYNNGYWMNYPENTGYTLKIYDNAYASKTDGAVRSIAFPYSTTDLKLPLKLDVEFNEANHNYWFMIYRNDGTYLGNTYNFKQGWNEEQVITGGDNKSKITTSAPGNYKLTLTYHDDGSGTVNYYIDVDFPIATGDYRIYYSDNATWSKGAHTKDSWNHPSHSIAKATTEAKKDTVSFFIPKGEGISHTMKFQKASVDGEGVVSWADVSGGSITIPSSVTSSGVYNFIVSQPSGGASISLEKVEPYTGNFYIRTDCAGNTKWDSFKNVDHQMTYSDYAEANSGYSHYYAHWVESGNNVSFTIANDYSMCISDTLTEDYGSTIANITTEENDGAGTLNSGDASIRFMWNQATNKISRAYISGSSNISDRFLVLEGDAKMFDENGNALSITGLNANEINLVDDQNFVYERTIKVQTGAEAKLTAKYNNNVQYFIGGASETVELLGGEPSATKHNMRIVYDFKTNRLVTAYIPEGEVAGELAIHADIMLVREHQNAGQQLTFANSEAKLTDVKTVYGVMRFNRWTLNNKSTAAGHAPVGDPKSTYERSLYWISFPFDVNLSDVFGFGTYGTHWIIEYYDGAERATEGYWKDSEGFWKYITNLRGVKLEAGKGYILALDLDLMRDNNETFWANDIQQVELFFPSAAAVENIKETDTEIDVPAHECTIAPRPGQTDDRRKKDSHWNIIGVPSYANYGSTLKDGSGNTVTWNDNPATKDLPFLYEWNMVDNSYTAQSGTTYPFKSMHAYMVQYSGTLKWSLASATPVSPVVARHTDAPQDVEFRLELQAGEKVADQTFVKMTTDEQITTAFDFNYDLSKQMNSGKANIYTMVEGYIQTAGNCLPMSEQTTVVPVGVKIAADGDYTFAIPEGTEGVGVTLIDQETGIRTSLSALAYTVSLEAGTYDERFVLEISPIHNVPTDQSAVRDQQTDVRKVLIDGLLYIVRDNKMYDARGAMIMEK